MHSLAIILLATELTAGLDILLYLNVIGSSHLHFANSLVENLVEHGHNVVSYNSSWRLSTECLSAMISTNAFSSADAYHTSLFIHSLTHLNIQSLLYSFIHWLCHSFTQLLINLFFSFRANIIFESHNHLDMYELFS